MKIKRLPFELPGLQGGGPKPTALSKAELESLSDEHYARAVAEVWPFCVYDILDLLRIRPVRVSAGRALCARRGRGRILIIGVRGDLLDVSS